MLDLWSERRRLWRQRGSARVRGQLCGQFMTVNVSEYACRALQHAQVWVTHTHASLAIRAVFKGDIRVQPPPPPKFWRFFRIVVNIFIDRSRSIQVNLWKIYTLNLPKLLRKCLLSSASFLAQKSPEIGSAGELTAPPDPVVRLRSLPPKGGEGRKENG